MLIDTLWHRNSYSCVGVNQQFHSQAGKPLWGQKLTSEGVLHPGDWTQRKAASLWLLQFFWKRCCISLCSSCPTKWDEKNAILPGILKRCPSVGWELQDPNALINPHPALLHKHCKGSFYSCAEGHRAPSCSVLGMLFVWKIPPGLLL